MNFFTINKQITVCPFIMQTQTELFILLCKINRIHFFCTQCMFYSLCWTFTQNQNISFPVINLFGELMSTPKYITFRPNQMAGNERLPFLLIPVPYPEYLYLSISAFLIKVTAPNKQFSSVGSLFVVLSVLFIS